MSDDVSKDIERAIEDAVTIRNRKKEKVKDSISKQESSSKAQKENPIIGEPDVELNCSDSLLLQVLDPLDISYAPGKMPDLNLEPEIVNYGRIENENLRKSKKERFPGFGIFRIMKHKSKK